MHLSLFSPALAPLKTKDLLGNFISGLDIASRKTTPPVDLFMGRLSFRESVREQELEEMLEHLNKLLSRMEVGRSNAQVCKLEELPLATYEPSRKLIARFLDEAKSAGGSFLQRLISMPRVTAEDASTTMVQAVLGALGHLVSTQVKAEAGVVRLDDNQLEELIGLIADRLGVVGSAYNDVAKAFASAVVHDVLGQLAESSGKLSLSCGWAAAQDTGTFVVQRKGQAQVAHATEDDGFRLAA